MATGIRRIQVDVTESPAPTLGGDALARLYDWRFPASERPHRDRLWRVLVECRLQRYVQDHEAVLDYGAGSGGFINHVRARRRVAVDLSPQLPKEVGTGVEALVGGVEQLQLLPAGSFDVVFSSNVLEHLSCRREVLEVLEAFRRLLAPGGRVVLIGPNYRYAYREYWDFFDHHLALSDRTVAEALAVAGFRVREHEPRFLPFTTKGRPASPLLLRLFFRLPVVLRRPFCGQFLLVGTPSDQG
jgi:SAM-dependent methyltransferase